jgi:hypothetical protein
MKRFAFTFVALGLVGVSPPAWGSCRWFGTQLECALAGRELLIGTQAAAEPSYVGAFRAQPLLGGGGLVEDRPVTSPPLRLELQNFGTDPGLCWRFGDEIYCH